MRCVSPTHTDYVQKHELTTEHHSALTTQTQAHDKIDYHDQRQKQQEPQHQQQQRQQEAPKKSGILMQHEVSGPLNGPSGLQVFLQVFLMARGRIVGLWGTWFKVIVWLVVSTPMKDISQPTNHPKYLVELTISKPPTSSHLFYPGDDW